MAAGDASSEVPVASDTEYVAPLIPMTEEERNAFKGPVRGNGYVVWLHENHTVEKHIEYLAKRMHMDTAHGAARKIGFDSCWDPIAYIAGIRAEGDLAHVRSDPGVKQVNEWAEKKSKFDPSTFRHPRSDPYHKNLSRTDAGKWVVSFKTRAWSMDEHQRAIGFEIPSFELEPVYNGYLAEMPLEQARALLADPTVRLVEREYLCSFYGL